MYRKSASALLCLLLASVFALIAAPRALAQIGGTGSIQGVVTDATGAMQFQTSAISSAGDVLR